MTANSDIVEPLLHHLTHVSLEIKRSDANGVLSNRLDQVAQEVPVALVYNGISHLVLMCTPTALEQLAIGFSITEGILQHIDELYDYETVTTEIGIEVHLTIAAQRFAQLKQRRRSLVGRTGCGICGSESLLQIKRQFTPLPQSFQLSIKQLVQATNRLLEQQFLHQITGATHAVAWVSQDGNTLQLQEDVGRHNALDKLLGWAIQQKLDMSKGFVVISSRASYEMVQKAASVGVQLVVAVSAPTALAVQIAQQANLTLVGWTRNNACSIFTHPQRIKSV